MQSTGQTSTHAVSFVPTQGSQMIYATHYSRNWYFVQRRSITRGFRAAACAAALCGGLARAGTAAAQARPASYDQDSAGAGRPADPPASPAQWREAPEYVALFVPRVYRDSYRAFVSTLSL